MRIEAQVVNWVAMCPCWRVSVPDSYHGYSLNTVHEALLKVSLRRGVGCWIVKANSHRCMNVEAMSFTAQCKMHFVQSYAPHRSVRE